MNFFMSNRITKLGLWK